MHQLQLGLLGALLKFFACSQFKPLPLDQDLRLRSGSMWSFIGSIWTYYPGNQMVAWILCRHNPFFSARPAHISWVCLFSYNYMRFWVSKAIQIREIIAIATLKYSRILVCMWFPGPLGEVKSMRSQLKKFKFFLATRFKGLLKLKCYQHTEI